MESPPTQTFVDLDAEWAEQERLDKLESIGDWLLETPEDEYDGDISTCQTCGQYWDGIVYKACPSCGGYLG